eukprot:scaffold126_cov178-Amphora_coffeaeformis.AAC.4
MDPEVSRIGPVVFHLVAKRLLYTVGRNVTHRGSACSSGGHLATTSGGQCVDGCTGLQLFPRGIK